MLHLEYRSPDGFPPGFLRELPPNKLAKLFAPAVWTAGIRNSLLQHQPGGLEIPFVAELLHPGEIGVVSPIFRQLVVECPPSRLLAQMRRSLLKPSLGFG